MAIVLLGCSGKSSNNTTTGEVLSATLVGIKLHNLSFKSRLENYLSEDLVDENNSVGYYEGGMTTLLFGGYQIAQIHTTALDGYIYLQDLVGVDREDYTHQSVINITRVLLALQNVDMLNENQTKLLNAFDMKGSVDQNVTDLLIELGFGDVSSDYARKHLAFYYLLTTKAPINDALDTHIANKYCFDVNTTVVEGMLSDYDAFKQVDVYINGQKQGVLTKDEMHNPLCFAF